MEDIGQTVVLEGLDVRDEPFDVPREMEQRIIVDLERIPIDEVRLSFHQSCSSEGGEEGTYDEYTRAMHERTPVDIVLRKLG